MKYQCTICNWGWTKHSTKEHMLFNNALRKEETVTQQFKAGDHAIFRRSNEKGGREVVLLKDKKIGWSVVPVEHQGKGPEYIEWADSENLFKKEEPVTQQFEVGDIVTVKGTVKQIDNYHRIYVKFTEVSTVTLLLMPNDDAVTLVERPDKFKVGQKYHPKGWSDSKMVYMYLGENAWYSYFHGKAYRSDEISENTRNAFVPVD